MKRRYPQGKKVSEKGTKGLRTLGRETKVYRAMRYAGDQLLSGELREDRAWQE